MRAEIIGRIKEQKELKEYMASQSSEFIAIYGRRQVGKTFLVREMFGDNFAFLAETKTRKSLQLTFVTTYGVKPNAYASRVQSEVLLEDLFAEA